MDKKFVEYLSANLSNKQTIDTVEELFQAWNNYIKGKVDTDDVKLDDTIEKFLKNAEYDELLFWDRLKEEWKKAEDKDSDWLRATLPRLEKEIF